MFPLPPSRPVSRPPKKRDFQQPSVVFQPEAAAGLQSGFDRLVDLVRPTLGPLPHIVAVERVGSPGVQPELLDSAATIARRVIQIPERNADVGLMYLRHVLWKLQESEGDGTATAAVLFQAIYNQGRRYVAAGGSAMALRQHLEDGLRALLAEIDRQVIHLEGREALAGLARTISYDDDLSRLLGEVFDIIGPFGRLEVRQSPTGEMNREYVEGMYWDSGLLSREMANADHGLRANLENPAILISDLAIERPEQLVPLLNLAVQNNIQQVLLVSRTLSEKAMGILLAKPNRERVHVVAVKLPGQRGDTQQAALQDLAVLTGGRVLLQVTGESLERLRLEDLGRARRAWADKEHFGIIGGRGSPRALREHIANLRQAFGSVRVRISSEGPAPDGDESARLLERLGKLMGGSATLLVGGFSPGAIDARIELAKGAAGAMRGALREGVVPGGGMALLHCRPAMRARLQAADSPDRRAAANILLHALEAPFRAILENAGVWPGRALAELEQCGPEFGYDALEEKIVPLAEAGLYDAAPVIKGALRAAISGAALALTTEAIVHRRNPPEGIHT